MRARVNAAAFGSCGSRLLGAALVVVAMSTATHSVAQDRELAESGDFRVRVQAALRLGRSGGAQARAQLERCLHDSHPAVRVACAAALGTVGDQGALAALEQAAKSESFASVRAAMREAATVLRSKRGVAVLQAPPEKPAANNVERAKFVVQLGAMRNNTTAGSSDIDNVMRRAARSRAGSMKDVVVLDGPDATILKRASERQIPVLLVDANLTRLTQTKGADGGVVVSAQVEMSIRKIPQQTLRGTVSGKASASDDAKAAMRGTDDLQNRAVGSAVESAISTMSTEMGNLVN